VKLREERARASADHKKDDDAGVEFDVDAFGGEIDADAFVGEPSFIPEPQSPKRDTLQEQLASAKDANCQLV